MRTLVIVLIPVGVLLGADEVAVIAAAKTLDSTTAAAPLFALWGAGSLIGGLLATRPGGGARSAGGLALVLGALTAGHLALIPAAGSVVALGAVLLLAGAAIAPTEATIYAMVDYAAPAGTMTEAFAWLATAMAVGGAAERERRLVADRAGPTAGFALAGGAGALAVLVTLLRSRTITRPPSRGTETERASPRAPQTQGDTMNTNPSTTQAQKSLVDTRWRLDPAASTAEFRVPHFWGLVTVKGHFERLDGYLELDDRRQRQMTLTIDAASLHTGNSKRDKHLRSGDFFDTANYPEVRFRSTSVSDAADDRLRVEGELSRRRARGADPRADDPPDRRPAAGRRDHDDRSATARDDLEPTRNDQVPRHAHRPRQPAAPTITSTIIVDPTSKPTNRACRLSIQVLADPHAGQPALRVKHCRVRARTEVLYHLDEPFGRLEMGKVAHVVEDREPRVGQELVGGHGVFHRDDRIVCSPDQLDRRLAGEMKPIARTNGLTAETDHASDGRQERQAMIGVVE